MSALPPQPEPRANESRQPETDQLLGHEYDGIQEYDNPMPKWWKWTFWATFYFSIGYFVHYHLTGNGPSVAEKYETELALAREQAAMRALGNEVTEPALANLMTQSEMMEDASKLFIQKCGPCHGNRGEGMIGPNLTDRFWLHGDASLLSIYEIIRDGVPAKGMPAWNRQLTPIELTKVAAYVGSLRGTDLTGPRGPEGKEVVIAEAKEADATAHPPAGTAANTSRATPTHDGSTALAPGTAAPSETSPNSSAQTAPAPSAPAPSADGN